MKLFGRITPERRQAEMLKEATELAEKYRVMALDYEAIAARLTIDARHHAELSHHYKSTAVRLSATKDETK